MQGKGLDRNVVIHWQAARRVLRRSLASEGREFMGIDVPKVSEWRKTHLASAAIGERCCLFWSTSHSLIIVGKQGLLLALHLSDP